MRLSSPAGFFTPSAVRPMALSRPECPADSERPPMGRSFCGRSESAESCSRRLCLTWLWLALGALPGPVSGPALNTNQTSPTLNGAADIVLHHDGPGRMRFRLLYWPTNTPARRSATRSGATVTLPWSAGETGRRFHRYRAGRTKGPFSWLTTHGAFPSTQFSWSVTDVPTNRGYMIRGLHLTSTASSSFWNLSQGSVKTSN